MYKQTGRSLCILFKELKYRCKLFTYYTTDESYLHIEIQMKIIYILNYR